MEAPIRYARSGEVNIAYQVTGSGPIDLVVVSGFVSHLDKDWYHPDSAWYIERLGTFARVIRFDKRGTGLSDRTVGLPDLETRMDDVRAVMDAVGSAMAHWWNERASAAASPAAARDLILMNSSIDVRSVLPAVQAPTLVLHRTGDRDVRVEEGRYIAARIPGARFVELEGNVHISWWNADQVLDEVEEFLTGVRPAPVPVRVLATVLFTDLVGSTERARALGDHAWAELLARHDAAVRSKLEQFAGEEIDTAGDGFFALFDGPARAVRCALSLVSALGELDLAVRAGVHTGEVERPAGGAPRGIAVHVGARVAAAAAPGEVLVSTTTRDLVAGSGLEFEGRGSFELKGVGLRKLYAATA